MKLPDKILKEVVSHVAGEEVFLLVQALKNKTNVSEFKIAEKLDLDINIVRNMLYKLYHADLVEFTRKKDKTKGWYIYYWTFKLKQIQDKSKEIKRKRLETIQERLHTEQNNQFFTCDHNCMRVSFDQATDFLFRCPECGELMDPQDNSQKIEDLEKEIKKLQAEIK